MPKQLTPLTAIDTLREIAANRATFIAGEKEMFAAIDADAKKRKEDVRTKHRKVNRELVEAIRQAQSFGVHVEDSAKIVGMSPQAIYRIEKEIERWDKAHPKETKEQQT